MAAGTGTKTSTKTYARLSLIRLQVSVALQETGALSDEQCSLLMHGITQKWIEYVRIYGLDAGGRAHAELRLQLDWERHEAHISAGRTDVTVGRSRLADGKSALLRECIDIFNEYVTANSLTVRMHVSYREQYASRLDEMNSKLGLVSATTPQFAGETLGEGMTDPDLDEFAAGIFLVDDD